MTDRDHRIWLLGLVLVAAVLRLSALDRVPPALHPDEAANAADALWAPLALTYPHEAGGWVEGGYVWSARPFLVAAHHGWLELETAVRLPAALAGLGLVPLTYLLARRLGGRHFALAAATLIAVEPWAIHFSRLGLRATLVPPLVTGGLLLLGPRWPRNLAGGVLLGLAAALYPPARLVVPLLALAALRWPPRGSRPVGAAAWAWVLPAWWVLVVLLPFTLGARGGARLQAVLALDSNLGVLENAYRLGRGYVLHFSTRFLFSGASSRGFAPEGVGLIHLIEAPLLLAGVWSCLSKRRRRHRFLLVWLLLFPLAAAFTQDVPNPMRAVLGLPLLALLAAEGLVVLSRLPRPAGLGQRVRVGCVAVLLFSWPGLARYGLLHPRREGDFYYAGRREVIRAMTVQVEAGRTLALRAPFVEAYLRLYAPDTLHRRIDGGWAVGSGEPGWDVRLGPPPLGAEILVSGRAWLMRSGTTIPRPSD